MSANQEQLAVLQKQRAALEARKLEELQLKEEEAKLMVHLFCCIYHEMIVLEYPETSQVGQALYL